MGNGRRSILCGKVLETWCQFSGSCLLVETASSFLAVEEKHLQKQPSKNQTSANRSVLSETQKAIFKILEEKCLKMLKNTPFHGLFMEN